MKLRKVLICLTAGVFGFSSLGFIHAAILLPKTNQTAFYFMCLITSVLLILAQICLEDKNENNKRNQKAGK